MGVTSAVSTLQRIMCGFGGCNEHADSCRTIGTGHLVFRATLFRSRLGFWIGLWHGLGLGLRLRHGLWSWLGLGLGLGLGLDSVDDTSVVLLHKSVLAVTVKLFAIRLIDWGHVGATCMTSTEKLSKSVAAACAMARAV